METAQEAAQLRSEAEAVLASDPQHINQWEALNMLADATIIEHNLNLGPQTKARPGPYRPRVPLDPWEPTAEEVEQVVEEVRSKAKQKKEMPAQLNFF